jgi:hypothetical protein
MSAWSRFKTPQQSFEEAKLSATDTILTFDLPDGRLSLNAGDLDVWAEHLTWCYRLMGIEPGATIAVQDFGNSPISFLGSALLMPGLRQGVAERMGGRFIGLDASVERVTLTPAVLAQLAVDALVVRDDVAGLLMAEMGKRGLKPRSPQLRTIFAFGGDSPPPPRIGNAPWRFLLNVAPAMLLAPECRHCGCFHLRAGFYGIDGSLIRNLKLADVQPYRLHDAEMLPIGSCGLEPNDRRMRFDNGTKGA